MYLNLNDSDEVWDDQMRRRTLEFPAGVARSESVAVQEKREGDPVWARVMLAVGLVFLGGAIIYFSVVVLR